MQPARTFLGLLIATLAVVGTAVAGPFEDAISAYDRGDNTTAIRLFRPLAGEGRADAQTRLGAMYDNGNGVAQDYAEAIKWYRNAADQGYAEAQNRLGLMYYDGNGVPKDQCASVQMVQPRCVQIRGFTGPASRGRNPEQRPSGRENDTGTDR